MALRRILVAGAGLDMMAEPRVVQEVMRLSGKADPSVLYIGTPTYDDPVRGSKQCAGLARAGCNVTELALAVGPAPAANDLRRVFQAADVVLVSGGNPLFAVGRWVRFGIDVLLRDALGRGAVICGGSCGAVVAFDAGHSDSRDPATFKNPNPDITNEQKSGWAYIRAPGLGLLPGLVCPHHDKTQSNGVLRATDFDSMLQRHSNEVGIGIDHFAALVIEGDAYSVLALTEREGSVLLDGSFSADRLGHPGIWRKVVSSDGEVKRTLVPQSGFISELLAAPSGPIVEDPSLSEARAENPDDDVPSTAWLEEV